MEAEKCHTSDCDQDAEYWFAPGKLVVCHGCYERLKEMFADADEQNEQNERNEEDEQGEG